MPLSASSECWPRTHAQPFGNIQRAYYFVSTRHFLHLFSRAEFHQFSCISSLSLPSIVWIYWLDLSIFCAISIFRSLDQFRSFDLSIISIFRSSIFRSFDLSIIPTFRYFSIFRASDLWDSSFWSVDARGCDELRMAALLPPLRKYRHKLSGVLSLVRGMHANIGALYLGTNVVSLFFLRFIPTCFLHRRGCRLLEIICFTDDGQWSDNLGSTSNMCEKGFLAKTTSKCQARGFCATHATCTSHDLGSRNCLHGAATTPFTSVRPY